MMRTSAHTPPPSNFARSSSAIVTQLGRTSFEMDHKMGGMLRDGEGAAMLKVNSPGMCDTKLLTAIKGLSIVVWLTTETESSNKEILVGVFETGLGDAWAGLAMTAPKRPPVYLMSCDGIFESRISKVVSFSTCKH